MAPAGSIRRSPLTNIDATTKAEASNVPETSHNMVLRDIGRFPQ